VRTLVIIGTVLAAGILALALAALVAWLRRPPT
jgi:hypothetical protein